MRSRQWILLRWWWWLQAKLVKDNWRKLELKTPEIDTLSTSPLSDFSDSFVADGSSLTFMTQYMRMDSTSMHPLWLFVLCYCLYNLTFLRAVAGDKCTGWAKVTQQFLKVCNFCVWWCRKAFRLSNLQYLIWSKTGILYFATFKYYLHKLSETIVH